jgi:hypothetical protein
LIDWCKGLNIALSNNSLSPGPSIIQGLEEDDQTDWANAAQSAAEGNSIKLIPKLDGTVGSTGSTKQPAQNDEWVQGSTSFVEVKYSPRAPAFIPPPPAPGAPPPPAPGAPPPPAPGAPAFIPPPPAPRGRRTRRGLPR